MYTLEDSRVGVELRYALVGRPLMHALDRRGVLGRHPFIAHVLAKDLLVRSGIGISLL